MIWPLMLRRTHERLTSGHAIERLTLLDALRNANEELRQHRRLLAGLRTGQVAMTNAVERILNARDV